MAEIEGRRERKKAQTRRTLAEAAMRLFLEHGYDRVGIRDIAAEADVAVSTVFKHFSGKEALVFEEDEEREAALVAAVRDRAPGTPVLYALRDHLIGTRAVPNFIVPVTDAHVRLVETTPELRDYADRMWLRHEASLADAITEATGAPKGDLSAAALARFALEAVFLARDRDDPKGALRDIFTFMENGWGTRPAAPGRPRG